MLNNFRKRYLPKGSQREKIARRIYYLVRDIVYLGPLRRRISRWIENTGNFADGYTPEDFGTTILYTDQNNLFSEYPFRERISGPVRPVKVSLISTLRNEADNTPQWMECIFRQSRLPDEVILVDGGSTDGTIELLNELANQSPVPIRIICEQNINIATGRNLAIRQAAYSVIAATDFGCRPEQTWLEKIVAPFERDEQIQMVSGWYIVNNSRGDILHRRAWPTLAQVNPADFIPSSRSIAFKKQVWEKAGGYPEWLTLTGEDTYFALELKKYSNLRAFVPDAVVRWFGPEDNQGYWQKNFSWSVGDGESGLHGSIYLSLARRILYGVMLILFLGGLLILSIWIRSSVWRTFTLLIYLISLTGMFIYLRKQKLSLREFFLEVGARIAQVRGFLAGAQRRKQVDLRRFREARGVVFILAGVPIHDTGGGSRGAQIALEFLRQHFLVVYLNKFDSYESVNLGLRIAHPNLLLYRFEDFSWESFYREYAEILDSKSCAALIEFPLREFVPTIEKLKKINTSIAYDLLDAWDTQLGSTWYSAEVEEQIITLSDVLIATAPVLSDHLRNKTNREVHLLPNAVNLRLFDARRPFLRPEDLPLAEQIITYIGALWGEWFDWDLLIRVAESFPKAAVVVIGDYQGQCPVHLPNLHFLGLKPQSRLPAYLAHSNVAVIPWKENEITRATSPLKLYEYLAMHVPVVAPDLPPLRDIPHVYLAHSPEQFLEKIQVAMSAQIYPDQIDNFLRLHSWEFRIQQLCKLMGIDKPASTA